MQEREAISVPPELWQILTFYLFKVSQSTSPNAQKRSNLYITGVLADIASCTKVRNSLEQPSYRRFSPTPVRALSPSKLPHAQMRSTLCITRALADFYLHLFKVSHLPHCLVHKSEILSVSSEVWQIFTC